MAQLIQVKGKEFVDKILRGERDFLEIELEEGFNFHICERAKELDEYLRQHNHQVEPFCISRSRFRNIAATRLHFPCLRALAVDFSNTNLSWSYFDSSFLKGANLTNTLLNEACLHNADLMYADFSGASLFQTDFRYASLLSVKNLQSAENLDTALFYQTKVAKNEREIIEKALKEKLFVDFH